MGLDMYLYGIRDRFDNHDYHIGHYRESVEIGYWRKANQIHNWFVNNVQDGVDNCATYPVSHAKLEELLGICESVLLEPEKAKDLLPTSPGFFFGSTNYDEWYFADVKNTIEILKWALSQDFDSFSYNSSW